MSDAELVKHCMCGCMYLEVECPNCNKVTDTDRIKALTEQLEAARADAKEAEAYAEELEVMNKNQEAMIRQADRRGDALEAKLAKAVEALREIASEASVTVHTHNKGGINYTRMYEDWRKLAVKRIDKARATLAEIEGEKP